ncbi:MAG TPA: DUF5683 domain-containing protein [Chitinophagaceae bacterium]|nr:DUF5683 domain-containing protein [Chitinophagaceae bacterium]
MQHQVRLFFILSLSFILHATIVYAQQKEDTLIIKPNPAADTSHKNIHAEDTVVKKKYNPKLAAIRSAIIPGWGQAYNKKYWKIPIVYGALGTTAGIFFYNLKWYKRLRKAVILLSDTITSNDNQIDPSLVGYSVDALRTGRNEYRQDIDYSVLFFLLFWGLNVVDANVDAHLKSFDVSRSISVRIKAGLDDHYNRPQISLVFFLKDNHKRLSLPLP